MIARSLAVLALVPVVLSGCSSTKDSAGDFTGAKQPVAQAIEDLQDAGRSGNAKKICSELLAASARKRVEAAGNGKTCADVLDKQLDDADTFELTVVSVSLDGAKGGSGATNATARVKSTENGKDRFDLFTLVKESGRWRVQGLGGV